MLEDRLKDLKVERDAKYDLKDEFPVEVKVAGIKEA